MKLLFSLITIALSGSIYADNFTLGFLDKNPILSGQFASLNNSLREKTSGKHTITVVNYTNANDLNKDLLNGKLNLIVTNTENVMEMNPSVDVLNIPYLFNTISSANVALNKGAGLDLLKGFKEGIAGKGFFTMGFRNIYSEYSLKNTDDLRSLIIGISPSQITERFFSIQGASPRVVPMNNMYSLAYYKNLNGLDSTFVNGYLNKFEVVQKYLNRTEHSIDTWVMLSNKKMFKTLPDNEKRIVDSVLSDFISKTNDSVSKNLFDVNEAFALQDIQKNGLLRIVEPGDTVKASFKNAVSQIVSQLSPSDRSLYLSLKTPEAK